MTLLKVWVREGYTVEEREFDGDLHEFDIVKDFETVAIITPDSLESQEQIITDLDAGEDVDGWEDGKGNVISID